MGAWGYLPFESNDALVWLEELESAGADVVRQTHARAGNRYVEAPDGAVAIDAAEVASASQGNPLGELPENDAGWDAHAPEIDAEYVEVALEAVERVVGEKPELADLRDDAEEPEWRETILGHDTSTSPVGSSRILSRPYRRA